MSYEGFYELLCSAGHLTCAGIYEDGNIGTTVGSKCSHKGCKCKIVWVNLVDTTNGSWDDAGERIDGYVDFEEDKRTICKECGSTIEVTYKIPKRKRR